MTTRVRGSKEKLVFPAPSDDHLCETGFLGTPLVELFENYQIDKKTSKLLEKLYKMGPKYSVLSNHIGFTNKVY